MPAVFAGSTFDGRVSKNSCTVIRGSPLWSAVEERVCGRWKGRNRRAPRRGEEQAEDDAEQRRERAGDERGLEVDGVRDGAEDKRCDAAEPHGKADGEP